MSAEAVESLLRLSDERQMHEQLRHSAWRDGYLAGQQTAWAEGYNAGAADAAVVIAEIEQEREAVRWWREWTAGINEARQDPGTRLARFMAALGADMRELEAAKARPPWRRSPRELCLTTLRHVRFADPGNAARIYDRTEANRRKQ